MIQPLRVHAGNVVPIQKPNTLTDRINNLKIGRELCEKENATEKINAFRSKIPVFKSRIGLNNGGSETIKSIALKSSTCNKVNYQNVEKQRQAKDPPIIENIDTESNCFLLSDYAPEIYKYLHYLEKSLALKANFLSKHNSLTPNMRAVLINWIIGVHRTFRLSPETLYLAVSIVDRVLARERVEKDQLQLLGASAIFVAAKFEEIYYPSVKDFVVICDNLYSKRDILRMELRILNVTNFELSGPSPLHFLRRGSKAAHADSRVHMVGKFLCELSLIEYQCAHWLPSLVAATALFIALRLVKSSDEADGNKQDLLFDESSIWTPTIEYYTGYSISEVRKHSAVICRLIISSEISKHQNCRKKYQSSKYMNVSNFSPNSMKIIKKLANI